MNSEKIHGFENLDFSFTKQISESRTTISQMTPLPSKRSTFSPTPRSPKNSMLERLQKMEKRINKIQGEKRQKSIEKIFEQKFLKKKQKQRQHSQKLKIQCLQTILKKRVEYQITEKIERRSKSKNRSSKEKLTSKRTSKEINRQKLAMQVQESLEKAIQKEMSLMETRPEKKIRVKTEISIGEQEITPKIKKKKTKYYLDKAIYGYYHLDSKQFLHVEKSMEYFNTLKQKAKLSIMGSENKIWLNKKSKYQNKKTVIFDLDETLIHCNESLDMKFNAKVLIKRQKRQSQVLRISVRPYAKELLQNLSKQFQVIIFTASESIYANEVIRVLDPNETIVQHKLFRQHCHVIKERFYLKNLQNLNRDLKDVILVDNSAYSYLMNEDNAVPILPYYEGTEDEQLRILQDYILKLKNVEDVRPYNRKHFKLHQYYNFDKARLLIKQLYM